MRCGVGGMIPATLAALVLLQMAVPGKVFGQATDSAGTRAAERRLSERGPDLLRIGRWSLFVSSLGTTGYGFITSVDADDRYDRLAEVCAGDPARCGLRTADGAYIDEEMEASYQSVLRQNRRARRALAAGQVGVAASALFFVLGLRHRGPPPNIPFEPSRLILESVGDAGIRVGVRVPLPALLGGTRGSGGRGH